MTPINLKALTGYAAAFLIFMSTMRLFLSTIKFGIPIMDYVSFSNIIVYVLDVLYGLTLFIIASGILLLMRNNIHGILLWFLQTDTRKFNFTSVMIFMLVLLSVFITRYYWFEKFSDNNTKLLKVLVFANVGVLGIIAKYILKITDTNLLLLFMVFLFLFLFTKIVVAKEKQNWDDDKKKTVVISFKKGNVFISTSRKRFITNTSEFAFTYDTLTHRYTSYPMSDISSITANGLDTVTNASQ